LRNGDQKGEQALLLRSFTRKGFNNPKEYIRDIQQRLKKAEIDPSSRQQILVTMSVKGLDKNLKADDRRPRREQADKALLLKTIL